MDELQTIQSKILQLEVTNCDFKICLQLGRCKTNALCFYWTCSSYVEHEDILHDQNDINESTRTQLDAISTALAELQAKRPDNTSRRPIGFIQPKDDDD